MRRWLIVALAVSVLVGGVVLARSRQSQEWPRTPETRAVRQASDWSLAHIQSATHVRGSVQIGDNACPTCRARVDHYNALAQQPHISGAIRIWTVSQCGGTAATAVVTDPNRRTLMVKNLGTTANVNIWIGFGTTGHVALTAANGWALGQHEGTGAASSQLVLDNYQGPLSCISTVAGMSLGVTEILR
jgi:hypothetical protein